MSKCLTLDRKPLQRALLQKDVQWHDNCPYICICSYTKLVQTARTACFLEEVAEKLRLPGHPARLRIFSVLRDKKFNVSQL